LRVLTASGEVELSRRYFWSKSTGGQCPTDAALGLQAAAVSPGAAELCCTMGLIQDFAQGATDLQRLTGLRVSKERLRQITEREAQAVIRAGGTERLPPAWTAAQAHVGESGPTRVYVGADGVKVRTVTQAEKAKRRQEHAVRRQQRSRAGVGHLRPLPPVRPGSAEGFKEMKLGLFYDQEKSRRHLWATGGNHEEFGRRLRQHAEALGLEQAQETLSLTDGGPWIRNQLLKQLPYLGAMLLDFYHLSEHIWETARTCLGEAKAAAWAEPQLHDLKHTGPRPVLAAIAGLRKQVRAPAKRKRLDLLRQYILERWEMVAYPEALARGWDIGSGPTEAACKNLTLRLKRTGMKWDVDHAEGMMNLVALRESGQWTDYWNRRRIA